MEELKDLQQMANAAVAKFEVYEGKDFILPQVFKDKVKSINSNFITYNKYSAIIETSGNQNGILNIYMPNQWFYIASYFTEYYNELIRYKKYALMVATKERLKSLNGGTLNASENVLLNRLNISGVSKSYLVKFITEYSWWYGAKTIDRGDFYVSPILSLANLVNASQSFVADLCAFLADKHDLVNAIINGEKEISENKTLTSTSIKNLQQIFYGAPGTGKSHTVKKETAEWEKRGRVVRTTFHPDSDYSTFVGAYKPTKKEVYVRDSTGRIVIEKDKPVKEEQISYEFVPQAFLNAYIEAWTNRDKPEFLIIEEINRGNCAQIFGDLFQLLDRDDNGYSEYAIKADRDLEMYLNKAFEDADIEDYPNVKSGKELLLPNNLYIRATMNTSDQSLFPIDSAFKRRWDWEYEPIKYKNTDWAIEINGNKYSWTSFQKEVNKRIFDDTNSEDKMLGDYFVKANNENVISEKLFVNKVLFYLWNDVCKDGDSDIFKIDDKTDVKFSDLYGENGTKMLLGMMDHLGVELISEEVQSESEDQSDETVSSTKHKKLNAVVLNGIRYDSSQGKFNLYLNVINKIGIEKVASIVEQSKYKRLGHPLISTTKYEEIEKSQQYGYEQVGDYYFVKGMNDDTKINLLELIKSELQLDMQIEIE